MALDDRSEVALREARKFKKSLRNQLHFALIIIALALGALAYFDVALKWMIVVGFYMGIGTLGEMIADIAYRFDMGRSYIELVVKETDDTVAQLLFDRRN